MLDAAALAAEFAEDLIVGTVRDVHGAVAGRVHRVTDKVAGGTTIGHRLHDGISKVVYTSISAEPEGLGQGADAGRPGGDRRRARGHRPGRFVRAAINGLIGDRLRDEGSRFSFDIGVRVDGRDVVADRDGLAAAYPDATDKVVVFVHGLSENEAYWNRAAQAEARGPGPAQLRRAAGRRGLDPGVPPGEHRPADRRERRRAGGAAGPAGASAGPLDVRRIALVGHSMGGLVIRAACAVSTDSEPTVDRQGDRRGLPGHPAPRRAAGARRQQGGGALGRLPESAPFGRILEYRSVGILDLRHGLARDVQNLPNARYRLVGATLTRSSRSVTSGTIGDYLVPFDSAMGRRRSGEEMFPGAETLHVPSADHFDLLNHDDIYAALREWLLDRSDPPTKEESPTG